MREKACCVSLSLSFCVNFLIYGEGPEGFLSSGFLPFSYTVYKYWTAETVRGCVIMPRNLNEIKRSWIRLQTARPSWLVRGGGGEGEPIRQKKQHSGSLLPYSLYSLSTGR